MDRKSLIFISCFSAMLLIVNFFFSHQNISRQQRARGDLGLSRSKDEQNRPAALSAALLKIGERGGSSSKPLEALKWANAYVGVTESSTPPPASLLIDGEALQRQCYLKNSGFFLYQAIDEMGLSELSVGDLTALKPQNLLGISATDAREYALYWDGSALKGDGSIPLGSLLVFVDSPLSLVGLYFPKEAKWVSLGGEFRRDRIKFSGLRELKSQRPEPIYTLENKTLQLVISGWGGGIEEINLPLQGKSHPASAIKAVEFDHQLARQSPRAALYPYPSENRELLAGGDRGAISPYTPQKGGYYPLLRRRLSARDESNTVQTQSCSIVSERPEIAGLTYKLLTLSKTEAVLQARSRSSRITKTFSLASPHQAPYCFEVSVKVEGDAADLWLTSGVPEVELLSGSAAPAVKYQVERGDRAQIVKMDLPAKTCVLSAVRPNWLCNSNGFFGLITRPLNSDASGFQIAQVPGEELPTRLSLIDASWQRFPPSKFPGYQTRTPLPARSGEYKFQVFAGPLAQKVLDRVDRKLGPDSGKLSPDFASCRSFHGWFAFISQPFAQILMLLMRLFYNLTRSWALSICLLTLALRLMLYPLNTWSLSSTQRMREISPQLQRIQQTHKKDPQRAQKEILQLYKDHKINPLSGCLPLLLQMPFLIGMFDLLKSSFELRGASFIPGWIDDLSAPDVLLSFGQPIPFFGNELHVLPLLVGLAMYWQQRASSPVATSLEGKQSEQQQQQKAVANIMTVVFTAMFYHFPSGLNLYWLSSILLGLAQQWWIQKKPQPVEILPAP